MRVLRFAAMVAACSCLPLLAGSAPRTISESDFSRVVGLRSPAISPDGKSALVLVSRTDWNDDTYKTQLVMIDIATHARRTLTYDMKGISDPTFAPDGRSIAFIADAGTGSEAKPQVYVLPLDGGDARPITSERSGILQYAWAPDSARIAFASAQAKPTLKGAARFEDSFIFTTQDIVDRQRPEPVHLFVTSASGGRAHQLTFGTRSVTAGEGESTLAWSPNGREIAVTVAPDPILNDESASRVAIVDASSGHLRYLTSHSMWESGALWSPDGAHIAYSFANGDPQVALVGLYVTTPAGGEGNDVSAPVDRTVTSAAWSPDSKSIYYTAPDKTTMALLRAQLGGDTQRIELGQLVLGSDLDGAVGRDGGMIFLGSSTKRPTELYYRSASGRISRLTDYNADVAALDLGNAEAIVYPTSTGIQGDAVLDVPPHFDPAKKYPLVVYIHGGPTSSSLLSFDFYAQVMAARGWLVLRPNYRGSNNLGIKYQRAVLYDPEAGPGQDIMAALHAVEARGIVDSRRIAVSGWSYGGIMTSWMISKYHVWAAAVSGAPVIDWTTDYGVADDSLADRDLFHGSPYVGNNAVEWRAASTLWYAKDVTTPVLLLSDVGDNRDPFATNSMYWRALRDNHKNATLRVWPVDGHFPHDPVRVADVYRYWIGFIAQHFK